MDAYCDPTELLSSLRWKADMRVISPDHGEAIYLKDCHGGVTECCLASDPCTWHSPIKGNS